MLHVENGNNWPCSFQEVINVKLLTDDAQTFDDERKQDSNNRSPEFTPTHDKKDVYANPTSLVEPEEIRNNFLIR